MHKTSQGKPARISSVHSRRFHALLAARVLKWFARQGRKLPWRGIASPYRILVSEIMLQQTQVTRVLMKYPGFLQRFPSLRSLARARQRDVVVAWEGLGYNNRAVRLHQCVRAVRDNHGGRIPAEYDALISLPGIGQYTANALLSSAFGQHVPIVDVNVKRFLSRVFWTMSSTGEMKSEKEIWRRASDVLPATDVYRWNQALMDIGATICTARQPRCNQCPVATLCTSRALMRHDSPSSLKREPSLDGIPNRIYRGRIINALRYRRRIHTELLGKMIYERYGGRNGPWLHGLLAGLEKDGLITVHRNGSKTSSFVTLV